jgi:hypothetical protein
VNSVLKERPSDPLDRIATLLNEASGKSFPIFAKFNARRFFLQDRLDMPSIKIDVYLQFKGRINLAHSHIFSYDEEEKNHFLWDVEQEKSGLKKTCELINKDFNNHIKAMVGEEPLNKEFLGKVDNALISFFRTSMSGARQGSRTNSREESKLAPPKADPKAPTAATAPNEESIGLNLVRACSEALTIAVAKTLTTEDIAEIFVYREEIKQASYSDQEAPSKFLVQLLTGGKAAGSAVKFSKFYLVVDTAIVEPD